MSENIINARDIKMLELLSQGGSSRELANALGYKEGTMRVYLHNLYRKLGVNTKTAAVAWYLASVHRNIDGAPDEHDAGIGPVLGESFGDLALRRGLLAALGYLGHYVGAYGRTWEVASRLKGAGGAGGASDATAATAASRAEAIRRTSRQLWEAWLGGDALFAKRIYERGFVPKLFVDSPSDCLLVACLLLVGGYTHAGERVMAQLKRRAKGSLGITASEQKLVWALRDALIGESEEALGLMHQLVADNASQPVFRHCAMVALFHAYRERRDDERARQVANALFVDAEGVRQQLVAMGENVAVYDGRMPAPVVAKKAEIKGYLERLERVGVV